MRSCFGVALLAPFLALAGCSSSSGPATVCSEACAKLEQCGVSRIHITSVKSYGYDPDCGGVACDSITECVSRCINAADCGALSTLVEGGPLHSCMIACNSWFRITDGG